METVCASDVILLAHHPELSARPEPKLGAIDVENRRAALTWNVFRTLELLPPAFWLRRFRARLGALMSLDPPGPSLSIRLWTALRPPAWRGRQEPVIIDALIDTDDAVYGVMTCAGSDIELGDSTVARPDAVLRAIDAVSWYAGTRACHIVLITSDWADTPMGTALIDRYRSSRDVLLRRLPHRRDGLVNVRDIARMTWRDVAGIMRDCADSTSLTIFERCAARQAVQWLDSLGIHPTD